MRQYQGQKVFETNAYNMCDEYVVKILIDFDFPNISKRIMQLAIFYGFKKKTTEATFKAYVDFLLQYLSSEAIRVSILGQDFSYVEEQLEKMTGLTSRGIEIVSVSHPYVKNMRFEVRQVFEYKDWVQSWQKNNHYQCCGAGNVNNIITVNLRQQ